MNAGVSNDSGVPTFFLSYARQRELRRPAARSDQDVEIRRFFTRLSEDVAQLLPPSPGQDPGFMDSVMQAGADWNNEILLAAGSCRVFVAALSPAYFDSEWCAMEWDLFCRRRVAPVGDQRPPAPTAAIIPVLWVPMRNRDRWPPIVRNVQMFTPTGIPGDTAAMYRQHGLLGLFRMDLEYAYKAVVWTLAQQVADTAYTHRVVPRIFNTSKGLRRTFARETP